MTIIVEYPYSHRFPDVAMKIRTTYEALGLERPPHETVEALLKRYPSQEYKLMLSTLQQTLQQRERENERLLTDVLSNAKTPPQKMDSCSQVKGKLSGSVPCMMPPSMSNRPTVIHTAARIPSVVLREYWLDRLRSFMEAKRPGDPENNAFLETLLLEYENQPYERILAELVLQFGVCEEDNRYAATYPIPTPTRTVRLPKPPLLQQHCKQNEETSSTTPNKQTTEGTSFMDVAEMDREVAVSVTVSGLNFVLYQNAGEYAQDALHEAIEKDFDDSVPRDLVLSRRVWQLQPAKDSKGKQNSFTIILIDLTVAADKTRSLSQHLRQCIRTGGFSIHAIRKIYAQILQGSSTWIAAVDVSIQDRSQSLWQ